jgi:hypothetical protein
MGNDIPVFDTIKEENIINSILNELSGKKTQQDEKSDKDQEQNESCVVPAHDIVSSIEGVNMLR